MLSLTLRILTMICFAKQIAKLKEDFSGVQSQNAKLRGKLAGEAPITPRKRHQASHEE
jgi:hypothetical protein